VRQRTPIDFGTRRGSGARGTQVHPPAQRLAQFVTCGDRDERGRAAISARFAARITA
jgi:hypothetical protein